MNELDDDDLHVDLTPLIDVIFMLVIFFIMTMSFSIPNIEFDLPNANSAQVSKNQDIFNLKVNKEGQFFFNQKPISKQEIVKIIKNSHYQSINLIIEKDAPAQYLIDVADLARMYLNGRLSIATLKDGNDFE